MPVPGVKSAVSDYEHLNFKHPYSIPADDDNGKDIDESDDFLPLKPPKPSHVTTNKQHTSQRLVDVNNSNVGEPREQAGGKLSLTQLLEEFGQMQGPSKVPQPTAWSPGMLINPNPALFLTPQKSQSVSESSRSENILEPQDVNRIPQPMAWSPGMVLQPNPSLLITPDKSAGSRVVCALQKGGNLRQYNTQKENISQDTLTKSKEKYTVRFDLPSASSGDDTIDPISDNESPITLKGSEIHTDGQTWGSPVWKSFSPTKAYNPNAYSDESSLEESYLNSIPSSKSRPLLSSTASSSSESFAGKQSHSISSNSEQSMGPPTAQLSLSSSFPPKGFGKSTSQTSLGQCSTLSSSFNEQLPFISTGPPQKVGPAMSKSLKTEKAKIPSQQKEAKSTVKAGPQFLKAPLSMYEPPPPGPYVVREARYESESSDYSYPFHVGAAGGDSEYEHAFARPEFNSTLKVRSELDGLCEREVDVKTAVEATLSKSETKRSELNEKAAVYTNRMSNQFKNLVDLDTSIEGLCERVVRMRTAKAPSKKKPLQVGKKQNESAERVPDLMEFFSSDLQKESPDLTLPGMSSVTPQLQTSPHDLAFDLYRHNRVWLGINDF